MTRKTTTTSIGNLILRLTVDDRQGGTELLIVNPRVEAVRVRLTDEEKKAGKAAYNVAYYASHKEAVQARCAAYRAEHKEEMKRYHAAYRATNIVKISARKAEAYKANPDGAKARACAWVKANPEKAKSTKEAWVKANPEKVRASQAAHYGVNHAKVKARALAWNKANPEKLKACNAAWRESNKDKVSSRMAVWRKANSGALSFSCAKRRAYKLRATPSWADLEAIKDVYLEAQYQQMHVDHIVPLQGKTVCGLHVWDNLQLLTSDENTRKGNRYWADMP